MTPTPSDEAVSLPTVAEGLPVVGYFNFQGNALCKGVPRFSTDIPLVRLADAEAQITTLRAEVDRKSDAIQKLWRERDEARAQVARLTRDLQLMTDDRDSWMEQAISRAKDAVELASRPDVEEVMALAEDYARARVLDEMATVRCLGMSAEEAAEVVANNARSALRAKLEGRT